MRLFAAIGAFLLLAAFLAGALFFALSRGPIEVPQPLKARLEAAISGQMGPSFKVSIGSLAIVLDENTRRPLLEARSLRLSTADKKPLLFVGSLETMLDPAALVRGEIRLVSVRVERGLARVRREADGRFEIAFAASEPRVKPRGETAEPESEAAGGGSVFESAAIEAAAFDILAMVDEFVTRPLFAEDFRLDVDDITVLFDDRQTGRNWRFEKGIASFMREGDMLRNDLRASLADGKFGPAHGRFTLSHAIGSDQLEMAVRLDNVATSDIADQVPPLDWLRVADAPTLGAMTLGFDRLDGLVKLEAALELGEDANAREQSPDGKDRARQGDGGREADSAAASTGSGSFFDAFLRHPIRHGKLYLAYDPAEEKFRFDELSVAGPLGTLHLEGHAYLTERVDGRPGGIIAQLHLVRGVLSGPPLLEAPLPLFGGNLDLRLQVRPDPVLDIGQLVLDTGHESFSIAGRLEQTAEGFTGRLDVQTERITHDRLLALWPLSLTPNTRKWFRENVDAGTISNVVFGILLEGAAIPPRLAASFDLADVRLRFIRTLPLLQNAHGFGELKDRKLTLAVLEGEVPVEGKGVIDVSDSTFTISDITTKPAPAEFALVAKGPLAAALDLLDHPPFRFLSKGGVPLDIANGQLSAKGTIAFPLVKKVPLEKIRLDLAGSLADVRSERIMPGHELRAALLDLRADNGGISIAGTASIDGRLPVEGRWRQRFGKDHAGRSRFEGRIELSPAFLDIFGIHLPPGSVSGRSWGDVALDLARGQPPAYLLESRLKGLVLAIPTLGWRKGANTIGDFHAEGRFGGAPSVDLLQIKALGLEAEGRIDLQPEGGFRQAVFERFDRGGWLSGRLTIGAAGKGGIVPIAIDRGRLDMTRARFGSDRGAGGARIRLGLERVKVSSGIFLTAVTGELTTKGGLSGKFQGRVGGAAPIQGTLAPGRRGGTTARIKAKDAGRVLRAAGVFENGRGGTLDLILRPTERAGVYDGHLGIRGIRVVNAPALAELLSLISVVGVLEQLSGPGLIFNEVEGRFRIEPDVVVIREASAVSASLGITMEGVYRLARRELDIRGVITPVYILNGLFEQTKLFGGLLGRKKGEGVFGFTYRLRGPVDAPQVSVNPLSALTPGFLREIFRSPPPTR